MGRKIKVLIVEDSMLFREVLSRGLSTDEQLEIVGTAVDPFDARDKILQFHPDVITCDVEMPKMNGIEFLRRLLPQHPIPVIVVSSVSDNVFDAMNAGAVGFVTKPNMQSPKSLENFLLGLIEKIKEASLAKVKTSQKSVAPQNKKYGDLHKMIAIGASTGGTEAIYSILKALPDDMPGIVIVQHIPPLFSKMFAERLNLQTHFEVKEAVSGDFVKRNTVLIAPGDQHMAIRKAGGSFKVETFKSERVNGHCPSVDVLFDSVAKQCKNEALGVILTGMGYDGAKGLLNMRMAGAKTIGQNEESSVVYGMPKVAYDIGAVEKQTSLEQVPQAICTMLK